MDTWFKLHIPVLMLSFGYPPSAFILLPLFMAGDALIIARLIFSKPI
ncbi:hypothetical protein YV74_000198 [Salmonella enterica subsp. enterica serovar Weltevreden]|nr:hypothetical protein [Salmonella enterica subsp. enterica serovar Weltevreden]EGQ7175142.1 hypothetical protein [Salmonella enterica subsp. enterica serovar Newport]ELE8949729.1 hypothetical protein [Salmonella enterica]